MSNSSASCSRASSAPHISHRTFCPSVLASHVTSSLPHCAHAWHVARHWVLVQAEHACPHGCNTDKLHANEQAYKHYVWGSCVLIAARSILGNLPSQLPVLKPPCHEGSDRRTLLSAVDATMQNITLVGEGRPPQLPTHSEYRLSFTKKVMAGHVGSCQVGMAANMHLAASRPELIQVRESARCTLGMSIATASRPPLEGSCSAYKSAANWLKRLMAACVPLTSPSVAAVAGRLLGNSSTSIQLPVGKWKKL